MNLADISNTCNGPREGDAVRHTACGVLHHARQAAPAALSTDAQGKPSSPQPPPPTACSLQVLKLAKKAAQRKQIKRGVKEVVKAIRKNAKGLLVIAGDISPIDVITPLPVLCEEADIPYIYVPSKEELGAAGCARAKGALCACAAAAAAQPAVRGVMAVSAREANLPANPWQGAARASRPRPRPPRPSVCVAHLAGPAPDGLVPSNRPPLVQPDQAADLVHAGAAQACQGLGQGRG